MGVRAVCFGVVLVLPLLLLPGASRAQETVSELAAECGAGSPDLTEWCREVALAGGAARAGFGLLSAGGSEVAGSAGTLGWRLGSVPRISLGVEVAGARMAAPGLGTEMRSILPDDPYFATALQVSGGVGLFDGFSPAPTVGGVLSLDLLGTGSFAFLPEDRGFDGASAAYGAGVRVGILRESFTLPGVSVSAVQRWGGEVELHGAGDGTAAVPPETSFDPSTTSIRATVGKDLVAVGLLLGAGWDRYAGTFRIAPGQPGNVDDSFPSGIESTTDDLVDSRFLAFGGASLNFLILQVSAEVGWAGGLDPVAGRSPGAGFDPTDASWFGSVGARLTY